jgi:hypothetical protein
MTHGITTEIIMIITTVVILLSSIRRHRRVVATGARVRRTRLPMDLPAATAGVAADDLLRVRCHRSHRHRVRPHAVAVAVAAVAGKTKVQSRHVLFDTAGRGLC